MQASNRFKVIFLSLLSLLSLALTSPNVWAQSRLRITQLTQGKKHHFFGYIGQSLTIPWSGDNRYVLCLEVDMIDRLPRPEESATITVIDTADSNRIIPLDQTHAWNPQQGTMFYWHPRYLNTQFFFNDRDIETGKVFTVLYDLSLKKRIKEYRFDSSAIGNGGISPDGKTFAAINYGRLARLRLVTGYPEALDWSASSLAPEDDGLFTVDIQSGEKRLLASYHTLEKMLKEKDSKLKHSGLFINHTLWNRESSRIYFFVRAGWGAGGKRINMPFSYNLKTKRLTMHETHIGGHPEWRFENVIMGSRKKDQVLYDLDQKKIVGTIASKKVFPKPYADIALSPDGHWLVNGYSHRDQHVYAFYRFSDGKSLRSKGVEKGRFRGDIRIDPAPRWNRSSSAILVPGIAKNQTRQMFQISFESER